MYENFKQSIFQVPMFQQFSVLREFLQVFNRDNDIDILIKTFEPQNVHSSDRIFQSP